MRETIAKKTSKLMRNKGKYAVKCRGIDNSHNTMTDTGNTSTAVNSSIQSVDTNQSPSSERAVNEPGRLKLVNLEQSLPVTRRDKSDSGSVKLLNLAKLPPMYSDTFDIHTMKMVNVKRPPVINSSSVNLSTPGEQSITPKDVYVNPAYSPWHKS